MGESGICRELFSEWQVALRKVEEMLAGAAIALRIVLLFRHFSVSGRGSRFDCVGFADAKNQGQQESTAIYSTRNVFSAMLLLSSFCPKTR